MATAAARCRSCCRLQVRQRRCMAVASVVGTGFVPRVSVVRRSMFDVTSTCGSRTALSPTTFALMYARTIVLTDFCAPVQHQQDSIEHRGVSLGGSTVD